MRHFTIRNRNSRFLVVCLWTSEVAILDLKIGFLVENCMCVYTGNVYNPKLNSTLETELISISIEVFILVNESSILVRPSDPFTVANILVPTFTE